MNSINGQGLRLHFSAVFLKELAGGGRVGHLRLRAVLHQP